MWFTVWTSGYDRWIDLIHAVSPDRGLPTLDLLLPLLASLFTAFIYPAPPLCRLASKSSFTSTPTSRNLSSSAPALPPRLPLIGDFEREASSLFVVISPTKAVFAVRGDAMGCYMQWSCDGKMRGRVWWQCMWQCSVGEVSMVALPQEARGPESHWSDVDGSTPPSSIADAHRVTVLSTDAWDYFAPSHLPTTTHQGQANSMIAINHVPRTTTPLWSNHRLRILLQHPRLCLCLLYFALVVASTCFTNIGWFLRGLNMGEKEWYNFEYGECVP